MVRSKQKMVEATKKMKGVILAGGEGTRLHPITQVTNKHLVPIGRIPMIEYPLNTLRQMGVDDISIVTGGSHFQDISQYLSKMHPKINFSFHCQNQAGGISQALYLAKPAIKDDKFAVILGDNIYLENFGKQFRDFYNSNNGASIFLKEVNDPERFGVAEVKGNKIISIEEKPKKPKSNFAVTGLYFYDQTVFDKIENLKPSKRGEYEISDVNNAYIKENKLGYHTTNDFWSDAGTHESREICENFIRNSDLEKKIFEELSKQ